MSVLLRQPHGFEGFGLGSKEPPPHGLALSENDRLPHRLDDLDAAERAVDAEHRHTAVAASATFCSCCDIATEAEGEAATESVEPDQS